MDEVAWARIGDGVELAYVERGDGEPVVLVHGSLADLGYWEQSEQLDRLSERRRVIAYSRRHNHPNRTAVSGSHSPMVEAADLAGLLDVLQLDRVHLVGHSYGAYTALVYALAHPDRLASLTLAEPPLLAWLPDIPGGDGIEEGFMSGVWEPLGRAFVDGGDEAGLEFTAQWYFQQTFDEVDPAWQTLMRDNVVEWRELARSPAAFARVDRAEVAALPVPTLLLSGGRNAGGYNDLIDAELLRLIPGAVRTVIADAGHEMFLEFPEESARALLEHLDRHPMG
ncbi:alpha/beta fold hydrolase [Nocardioides limicola]|uniref:alpha/beta fold hydrolase n=1 Tax=Nocardioides limicola TaxID=2803368 RepID=UPI00193B9FA6|nr:alpha/beta hydrolase [Nocardioides sp. DJM-14]